MTKIVTQNRCIVERRFKVEPRDVTPAATRIGGTLHVAR